MLYRCLLIEKAPAPSRCLNHYCSTFFIAIVIRPLASRQKKSNEFVRSDNHPNHRVLDQRALNTYWWGGVTACHVATFDRIPSQEIQERRGLSA